MASVTFTVTIGGNGLVITDDADPDTGLANGGHRTRFLQCLQQLVAIAQRCAENAQAAVNAPGTLATSVTSLTIGTGAKALNVEAGKSLAIGMSVKIANTADGTKWMHGDITAYDSGTGALTVNVTTINGAGTLAAWTVSVSGPNYANTFVTNSLFDANSLLVANIDDVPLALPVPASTFIGRKAAGNIAAMTPAEARAELAIEMATAETFFMGQL